MKKVISFLLMVLLCGLLAVPALAAPEGPVITMQPQSPSYPQYSVAIYTVKASGSNLTATWFIEYQGQTYNASAIGGAMQPWEAFAGESYGARKADENTFTFIFEGIGQELNGAQIWCVLEDGHYSLTSQKAFITVGGTAMPPEILSMPAELTVERGQEALLRCVARSGSEAQLSFVWYETASGDLQDIQAVGRGTETSDFLLCDTSVVGTRYYVCAVSSTAGGMSYSSVVPVTVTEPAPKPTQPAETTAPTQPAKTESGKKPQTQTAAPTVAPTEPAPRQTSGDGISVSVLLAVAVVSALVGVGVAVLLLKKK